MSVASAATGRTAAERRTDALAPALPKSPAREGRAGTAATAPRLDAEDETVTEESAERADMVAEAILGRGREVLRRWKDGRQRKGDGKKEEIYVIFN